MAVGHRSALVGYNAGIGAREKAEQWQRALALVAHMPARRLAPDDPAVSANLAIRWAELGRRPDAIAALAPVVGSGHASATTHYNLARQQQRVSAAGQRGPPPPKAQSCPS